MHRDGDLPRQVAFDILLELLQSPRGPVLLGRSGGDPELDRSTLGESGIRRREQKRPGQQSPSGDHVPTPSVTDFHPVGSQTVTDNFPIPSISASTLSPTDRKVCFGAPTPAGVPVST